MKTLIVEDDLTSRILLEKILSPYGECRNASNGREAVEAFQTARNGGAPFDLICLDIKMPVMDGQETLKEIRALEEAAGIQVGEGVKIIMTTALGDPKNVIKAHYQVCNAYLVKPIDKAKLLEHLKSFSLI